MASNQTAPPSNQLIFKQMRLEDITKDPLTGLQNFAGIYNQFGLAVYTLLSGQLEFDENINSLITSVSFATPNNYSDGINTNFSTVAFKAPFSPNGVIKLGIQQINTSTVFIKPVDFSWIYNANGQIVITYVTGLQPNNNYTLSLLII